MHRIGRCVVWVGLFCLAVPHTSPQTLRSVRIGQTPLTAGVLRTRTSRRPEHPFPPHTMPLNTRLTMVTALLLALVGLPVPLCADPITLTGGTVEVAVGIHSARITLIGDGFLLRTGTENFLTALMASPFPEGTTVNLGSEWHPTDEFAGEATFNGVHYPQLYFGLPPTGGTFMAPSVTLTGEGLHTETAPFTFSGVVAAYATPSTFDAPVFTATLIGSGTVRAGFFGVPAQFGEPVLHTPSTLPGTDFDLEYVFSPSAIPEPGTLVLLCTGVLAIAAARYRSLSKPPAHSARTTPVPPAAV
jgi:hypothetical protein